MSENVSPERWRWISALFDEAWELPPERREAFLDEACAGDSEIRRRVVELLEAAERSASPLDQPAMAHAGSLLRHVAQEEPAQPTESLKDAGSPEEIATPIGPYRPLQKLGEGGMGEVWLAEQTEPIRRKVALKLIKAGMDTKQFVARFEAERQALALMDHPSIAKVFDAGTTPKGLPYFVMEYVRGEPITVYSDRQRLTTRERLELFSQVCEGVQHAHQKGIIHRDLKPSNVLITVQGEKPVPKIIDFGVAKATAQRLTERTMFTELGVLIGTPEYMSPEQAEMTGLDVDTRTDVYALGVILYELLTGALPFDPKDFRAAGFDEIRRRIREVQPPRPSTRVSTFGDKATESARRRRTDPAKLVSRLKGDLDWITMKALEKDRTRRYGSPNELAADIVRYLSDQPVLAGPPSAAYGARKFVRRHRGMVASVSGIILALAAGVVASTLLYFRSEESREEATAVAQFLGGMIADVSPRGGSKDITVREVLDRASGTVSDRFKGKPLVEAYLHQVMASSYQDLGVWSEAEQHAAAAARLRRDSLGDEDPSRLESMRVLAASLNRQGKLAEARAVLDELIPLSRRVLGDESRETLAAMSEKGIVLLYQGTFAQGEVLHRRVYEVRRRLFGDDHPDTLKSAYWLAQSALRQGRAPEAETWLREVLRRRVLGPEHPDTLEIMNILCWALNAQGKHAEAAEVLKQVLEIRRRVLGDKHPDTLKTIYDLACVSATSGDRREALELLRKAIESGYAHVEVMSTDPDLDSLRGTPEFDRLFAAAKRNEGRLAQASP